MITHMRNELFAAVFVALIAVGAGCSSAPKGEAPPAPGAIVFGTAVTLSVGGTASFQDGLSVTLAKIDDSRCPPDVVCIWQGELSATFRARGGKLGDEARELVLGTVRGTVAALDGYEFTLRDATPASATFVVSEDQER
jgi:hypothetical protein